MYDVVSWYLLEKKKCIRLASNRVVHKNQATLWRHLVDRPLWCDHLWSLTWSLFEDNGRINKTECMLFAICFEPWLLNFHMYLNSLAVRVFRPIYISCCLWSRRSRIDSTSSMVETNATFKALTLNWFISLVFKHVFVTYDVLKLAFKTQPQWLTLGFHHDLQLKCNSKKWIHPIQNNILKKKKTVEIRTLPNTKIKGFKHGNLKSWWEIPIITAF